MRQWQSSIRQPNQYSVVVYLFIAKSIALAIRVQKIEYIEEQNVGESSPLSSAPGAGCWMCDNPGEQCHRQQPLAATTIDGIPSQVDAEVLRGWASLHGAKRMLPFGLLLSPLCAAESAQDALLACHRPRSQSFPRESLVFLVSI